MKAIKDRIKKDAKKYYGDDLNIVQVYADPNVSNCYVCRVEDNQGNWCFIVNYSFGKSIDDAMVEDGIELEPGQKISKKLFGDLPILK